MGQELIETGTNDPAATAFDRLRREVTTLRLAVERLADEPTRIEIPDYTETLGKMATSIAAASTGLQELRSAPALELTPQELTRQIAAAGAEARKIEQGALADATSTFVKFGREMASFVASAKTEQQQIRWLIWTAAASAIAGALVWTILSLIANQLAPASWHWPEKTAASALGRDMWDAGERLQAVAHPKQWEARSAIEAATVDSQEDITACLDAVARTRKSVQCSIAFTPEKLPRQE